MNKTTLHLVFAFALLGSLTVGLASVDVAEANFFIGPYISIISPVSWRVYTNTTIPLEVMASIRADAPEIVRFFYSVDAHSNLTLGNLTKSNTVGGYEFYASSVLKDLAQGNHTLNVYSQDDSEKEMFTSVEFMIDTNFLSPVSMLSPKNITYTTSNVSLTVLCSEKINWAYYRLDDIDGAPTKDGALSENFTLLGKNNS